MSLLGGANVIGGCVVLPRIGVWSATLDVDADSVPVGPQTLAVERTGGAPPDELEGTVVAAEAYGGRVQVRMLGGAGTLTRSPLRPRQWVGAPTVALSTLLADLARETRETFAAAPAVTVTRWARAAGTGARDLGRLAQAVGLDWRMELDGTVALLRETWSPASGDFEVHAVDEGAEILHVVPDGLSLRPGTAIDAMRIERVVYQLGDEQQRAKAFYSRVP